MSKPFDMELFLAGVLTGSHATRLRHLRQARIIQAEISECWPGSDRRLGLGRKSMWLGFLSIA